MVRLDPRAIRTFETGIEVQRVRISVSMLLRSARQMQNHHEGHAAVGRHVIEESVKRVDAARGGADPDDGDCS